MTKLLTQAFAGRKKRTISHRARRERREEEMNLLTQEIELFFSVAPGSSSERRERA